MATLKYLLLALVLYLMSVVPSESKDRKRQADCFNPFYKPPYCYGFGFGTPGFGTPGFGTPGFGAPGFGFGNPFGFGAAPGFGYPGFGNFGAGFGAPPFGFGAPFPPGAKVYGGGVSVGGEVSGSFGNTGEHGDKQSSRAKGPSVKSRNPFYQPFGGFGGFDSNFGDYGFPFGGFGSPYRFGFNPYIPTMPDLDLPPMPVVKTKGPGWHTSSGSTMYSFGPEGTKTSTMNQMVTTEAEDGTWTIQSSGFPMTTEPDDGSILITAEIGKPTKTEKELVNAHEIQFNYSYKDEPKKWINVKVDEKGPNLAEMTAEQKGDLVYIRGPEKTKAPTTPTEGF